MKQPLDYEPRIEADPRHTRFWLTFIMTAAVTLPVSSLLLGRLFGTAGRVPLLAGIACTAVAIYAARFPHWYALAVAAGVLGPLACAVSMIRLWSALS